MYFFLDTLLTVKFHPVVHGFLCSLKNSCWFLFNTTDFDPFLFTATKCAYVNTMDFDTFLFTATKCAYVNTMDFDTFLFTATKCANSFIPVFLPVCTWYETCAHC